MSELGLRLIMTFHLAFEFTAFPWTLLLFGYQHVAAGTNLCFGDLDFWSDRSRYVRTEERHETSVVSEEFPRKRVKHFDRLDNFTVFQKFRVAIVCIQKKFSVIKPITNIASAKFQLKEIQ